VPYVMGRSASSTTVTIPRCDCVVITDQEKVVKPMKRFLVLVSMLLLGLMPGCVSNSDLHVLQADTSALARQSSAHEQTVEARVQQLRDRVAQFEQSQAETRRDAARVADTLDTLRSQLQSLRGTSRRSSTRLAPRPSWPILKPACVIWNNNSAFHHSRGCLICSR